jgi:tetratricopeptide (TPR) repeat protein
MWGRPSRPGKAGFYYQRRFGMGDTVKRKNRWFLMAELAVLVCVFCIWLTTLVAANFDRAEGAVTKAKVERNPDNMDTNELSVNTDLESCDYQEAAEAHEQVMRAKTEGSASAHLMPGDVYCDADHPGRASESFNTAKRSNPNSSEAPDDLAAAQVWLDRCEDAIEFLDEITRIIESDADAHPIPGSANYHTNYPEEAIDRYKAVIRLDPDCFDAHLALGDAYYRLGCYAEAIECFQEAVRIVPDSAWAWTFLGLAYSDCGRYEDAVEVYNQVIILKPDVTALNLLLGQAYFKMGYYDEAIASFEKVVDEEPDRGDAHYSLAEAYLRIGNRDLALEEYEVLRILDEGLADALFLLLQE